MPFQILRGDITRQRVDAIVNAANSSLLGGGGVDGAIHRAAGPKLLEECRLLGGCRTGEAKATGAYELQARYVIHTVGPVWYGGARGEEALLTACYENSLRLAQELGCGSVAFPLISAGVYGYPLDAALAVATGAIRRFLENSDMEVRLVLFYGVDVPLPPEVDAALSWRLEEAARPGDVRYRGPALKSQSAAPAAQSRPRMAVAGESSSLSVSRSGVSECEACAPGDRSELDRLLTRRQENFSQALMRLIDESGLSDSECYKRANIDRRHFSKIRSNPDYRPGKLTVFAFAVALRLDLRKTRELLRTAGYALSPSSKTDIILEYFIGQGRFDIYEINSALFHYDLPLLGASEA